MPLDLGSVERGYGECDVVHEGNAIVVRYRVDLDGRATNAMLKTMRGIPIRLPDGSVLRVPDTDLMHSEIVRLLLPCTEEIPEDERGWDITRDGKPIPVTIEELERLPLGLPGNILAMVMKDAQDPKRRRLSLNGSAARAGSPPIEFPTTTPSSRTASGQERPSGPSRDSETKQSSGFAGDSGYAV